MIRIGKSANIPAKLSSDGKTETDKMCLAFESDPAAFTSLPGQENPDVRKFDIVGRIYGHDTVKEQLIAEQHGKCCFCEGKFRENAYGDVEHYRPKKAVKIAGIRRYTYPGYYWLGYDWGNLFFSCQICNSSYKGNKFPLTNEANRIRDHRNQQNLAQENPILISPLEDVEQFIQFRKEVPFAVGDNTRGETSIKIYGLDREELNEARAFYLELLGNAIIFAGLDHNDPAIQQSAQNILGISVDELKEKIEIADRLFDNAAKLHFPYTNMIRCNFPGLPQN